MRPENSGFISVVLNLHLATLVNAALASDQRTIHNIIGAFDPALWSQPCVVTPHTQALLHRRLLIRTMYVSVQISESDESRTISLSLSHQQLPEQLFRLRQSMVISGTA